ncbi:hypothetical protein [Helicobacter sp. MIT 05-5294]|nr:hypothetical protein [Helicobacter sp. MIT 05-5294]
MKQISPALVQILNFSNQRFYRCVIVRKPLGFRGNLQYNDSG